jgi:F0F1-type ATP synthase membrane subunit b/b'
MSEPTQLDLWKTEGEVSIEQMDDAVKKLRQAKERKSEAKAVLDAANKDYSEAEAQVMSLMQEAGKETYIAEGFGRVTLREELSVRTPKSPEEKEAFFKWIRENMGEDAYFAYMSVNSRSLNSLYKQKTEEYGERGELLQIDGLSEPTAFTKLSFTKA